MRIVTRFRDYYDAGLSEGQDRTLVFVRHTEEWAANSEVPSTLSPLLDAYNEWNPGSFHVTRPNAELAELRVAFGIIWFAGRAYPFAGLRVRHTGDVEYGQARFSYTLDALEQALGAYGRRLPERKSGRVRFGPPRPSFSSFFERSGSEQLHAIATENRIAVASVYESEVKLNGRLKDYEFFRCLPAYQAFQELSMFLGNLAAPDRVPVHVADKDRIQQHGFDEWSFRKPPQG